LVLQKDVLAFPKSAMSALKGFLYTNLHDDASHHQPDLPGSPWVFHDTRPIGGASLPCSIPRAVRMPLGETRAGSHELPGTGSHPHRRSSSSRDGILADSGAKIAKAGPAPHGDESPLVPVGVGYALLNWEHVVSVKAQNVPNSHA